MSAEDDWCVFILAIIYFPYIYLLVSIWIKVHLFATPPWLGLIINPVIMRDRSRAHWFVTQSSVNLNHVTSILQIWTQINVSKPFFRFCFINGVPVFILGSFVHDTKPSHGAFFALESLMLELLFALAEGTPPAGPLRSRRRSWPLLSEVFMRCWLGASLPLTSPVTETLI